MAQTVLNRPVPHPDARLQLLQDPNWQMSFGERAAFEGVLCQLKPRLAIEIGTAEGGSLARIAAHGAEVHSFDLVRPGEAVDSLENVTVHSGDNHELLPRLLRDLSDANRNVDFVLVDGDHSSEGVARDVEDLLASRAVGDTVILLHDSMNPVVRAGLERVPYQSHPKVAYVDLDFVAGYMFREPSLLNEMWGGLGLVVVDSARAAYFSNRAVQERYYPAFELLQLARKDVVSVGREEQVAELEERLAETQGWLEDVQASASWRLTAPLRAAKRSFRRPGE